ncbi:glycosyltransferase [Alkalilimnicola ehrlichii MLHE-1]|uniref:Glycosyl transferase, family 2 n=1 Tax=Alkalilimnicola ehrlichii (strain ATCC BAA-1101 / DSM 17681 / MLHE-1) TaxID=187272 RepID=Q0A8G3_ALKEH|nr:glycosyltransferase [Alkalilimnicola ehrlichii]ABI56874.1 glycosyl transferase, family 2 [Alkalilimnicola ehrlichii MLHE-1]
MPPPTLSVIIPAWNEARELPATLRALEEAINGSGLSVEVIVVDNDSEDETAAIARQAGARVVHEPERRIARVRNRGAEFATAPWLLFLDADTRVTPVHLLAVRDALSGEWAGGGVPVAMDRPLPRFPALGLSLWNALSRRFSLAAGCFFFVRAELHRSVGGFPEHVYAGEEVGHSRRLQRIARQRGLRFGILDAEPVVTSGRKLDWYATWQHALVALVFVVFPWAGRFRRLSWFWYRRPD